MFVVEVRRSPGIALLSPENQDTSRLSSCKCQCLALVITQTLLVDGKGDSDSASFEPQGVCVVKRGGRGQCLDAASPFNWISICCW